MYRSYDVIGRGDDVSGDAASATYYVTADGRKYTSWAAAKIIPGMENNVSRVTERNDGNIIEDGMASGDQSSNVGVGDALVSEVAAAAAAAATREVLENDQLFASTSAATTTTTAVSSDMQQPQQPPSPLDNDPISVDGLRESWRDSPCTGGMETATVPTENQALETPENTATFTVAQAENGAQEAMGDETNTPSTDSAEEGERLVSETEAAVGGGERDKREGPEELKEEEGEEEEEEPVWVVKMQELYPKYQARFAFSFVLLLWWL